MDREPTFNEVWMAFTAPFRVMGRGIAEGFILAVRRVMLLAPWVPTTVHEPTLVETMRELNERIAIFARAASEEREA